MPQSTYNIVRRKVVFEAIVIFTVCLVLFVIASNLGLHEILHQWASDGRPLEGDVPGQGRLDVGWQGWGWLALLVWPDFGADEIITAGLFLSLALAIFTSLQLLRMNRTLKERMAAEAVARQLAFHDTLTGLPNRLQFEKWVDSRCRAPEAGIRALLFIDLDGFKPVNDLHGHAAGDQVLVLVANRLSNLRGAEICARFGGDEFAMLSAPLISRDQAHDLAQRVLALFQDPFQCADSRAFVGASVGVTMLDGAGDDMAEKLREADMALYASKWAGRNRISFFDVEMDTSVRASKRLEDRLRQAIDNDQIIPHFQPMVDFRSGDLVGFEALARWNDPIDGNVPPDVFIPAAEQLGLIDEIGRSMLVKAARAAAQWPSTLSLAVNVSAGQLNDPSLALKMLKILSDEGLSPHRLEIEISENALAADIHEARHTLRQFQAAGIKIVLDDFGTGHSSLGHLRLCKFDMLKIDRSFVHALGNDSDSTKIVTAIVGLARSFGIQVVGEGVETEDQRAQLQALGCDRGQGYLFSRPVADVGHLLDGSLARRLSSIS